MWKVDLNADQQKKLKEVYFVQAWDKFMDDGNLNEKDSYRFLKDLMTMPIVPKNLDVEKAKAVKKVETHQNAIKKAADKNSLFQMPQSLATMPHKKQFDSGEALKKLKETQDLSQQLDVIKQQAELLLGSALPAEGTEDLLQTQTTEQAQANVVEK